MAFRKIIPLDYYINSDIIFLSKDLLGKFLFTEFNGKLTGGMIIETEAYKAPEDKASHAYGYRRTKRNEVMYHRGGVSYVYHCYGIHSLFNIVTNEKEVPHAILVRAIKPVVGIETMLERRKMDNVAKNLSSGPGTLSQALGITTQYNGFRLDKAPIWIEDHNVKVKDIVAGPRVGIDYAGEHAKLPWRFKL